MMEKLWQLFQINMNEGLYIKQINSERINRVHTYWSVIV